MRRRTVIGITHVRGIVLDCLEMLQVTRHMFTRHGNDVGTYIALAESKVDRGTNCEYSTNLQGTHSHELIDIHMSSHRSFYLATRIVMVVRKVRVIGRLLSLN